MAQILFVNIYMQESKRKFRSNLVGPAMGETIQSMQQISEARFSYCLGHHLSLTHTITVFSAHSTR